VLSVTLGAGLEQVIFIGGFASALGEVYLRIMRGLLEELSQYSVLAGYLPRLLKLGEMGDEASLQGAAIFANRVALPELRMRLDRSSRFSAASHHLLSGGETDSSSP
jgi:hypothetical protein